MSDKAPARLRVPRRQPDQRSAAPLLLLGEPDPVLGEFLEQILTEWHYQVRLAVTAEDVLAQAFDGKRQIAVALISTAIPPHGGATVCLRLQPYGIGRLVLMGPVAAGGAAQAQAVGATFLSLPFSVADLQAALQPTPT